MKRKQRKRSIRWNRVIGVALAIIVIIGGACFQFGDYVKGEDTLVQGDNFKAYVVQSGDTLWGVASTIATDHDDIREIMWQIEQDNHLTTGTLYTGQVLQLRNK